MPICAPLWAANDLPEVRRPIAGPGRNRNVRSGKSGSSKLPFVPIPYLPLTAADLRHKFGSGVASFGGVKIPHFHPTKALHRSL